MKIILISIIFFTSLFSDLLVLTKNISKTSFCVSDNYTETSTNITFNWLPNKGQITLNHENIVEIKTGYKYNPTTSICESTTTNPETPTNPTPDENGLIMGMKETDFHLAMALWGVCLSFLMSIGLIISF